MQQLFIMEITHIIINNNLLFLFRKTKDAPLSIYSYDINKNYKVIKKISFTSEYLDYYMNCLILHKNNFYMFGGLFGGELRSLKYMTIINENLDDINILKSDDYFTPEKRLFIENNNCVVINDILYMAGGCLDDSDIIDWNNMSCEKSVFKDFWSYDIQNKKWKCISKNIFEEFKSKNFDYVEMSSHENNIFFTGKFILNGIYFYNTNNKIFQHINFCFRELLDIEYYVQKLFVVENHIFLIMKNRKNISVCKFNLQNNSFYAYNLCNNINSDILLSHDNNTLHIVERKNKKKITPLRFDNNLFDMMTNKINLNIDKFENYIMLKKIEHFS